MVAKDERPLNATSNNGSSGLEDSRLAIKYVVVQMISSKDYKVWFLGIHDLFNKVHREWVSLTVWQFLPLPHQLHRDKYRHHLLDACQRSEQS